VAAAADAVAAPTVPFGFADFFRAVPGGIQLRATTFVAVVEDVVTAFLDHGIDHLVILNGHTTNAPLIDQAVRGIRRTTGVVVPSINLWQCLPDTVWREIHGADAAAVRGHGGDPVTSAYLHLFPDLVRPDLVRPSGRRPAFGLPTVGPAGVRFEASTVQMPLDCTEINADGMLGGDASRASAAAGARIVAEIVGFCARFVTHFRGCDPRDPAPAPAEAEA
jgi:creatinine amidohydrolase